MANTKTVSFTEEQFNTLCNMFQLMAVAGLKFHATGNALPTDEQIKDIWRTLLRSALGRPEYDSGEGPQRTIETPIE